MRAPGPCAECGAEAAARYRCPRCGTAYCSVPCCRTHRERCAPGARREEEAAGPGSPPVPAGSPGAPEDILGEEEEQDRVPPQKLQLLARRVEKVIKNLLSGWRQQTDTMIPREELLPPYQESSDLEEPRKLINKMKGGAEIKQKHPGESAELRDLLRNPHLRQLLLALEQARDKSSLLRRLMQEPLFLEFADCCLGIVEPPEEKENVLPVLPE